VKDAIFVKFNNKCLQHVKLHISRYIRCVFFQEAFFGGSAVDTKKPGPGHWPSHGLGLVLAWAWPPPNPGPGPSPGTQRQTFPDTTPKDKSRVARYKSRCSNTSPNIQMQVQASQMQVYTSRIHGNRCIVIYFRISYMHIYI
jgi:hypothetical protein